MPSLSQDRNDYFLMLFFARRLSRICVPIVTDQLQDRDCNDPCWKEFRGEFEGSVLNFYLFPINSEFFLISRLRVRLF